MLKICKQVFSLVGMLIFLSGENLLGQLDERFGSVGVEGTMFLGQQGLGWYRDWADSYLPTSYPQPGKNKIWTVGKIDYRTDDLGMDYRWIILDLLEATNVDFLQSFFNLCLAVVDKGIIPVIGDYWTAQVPVLEATLQETLDNFVYTDMQMRIKYRAKTKNSHINFQEELPKFELSVVDSAILFSTSLKVDWTTHIFIEAWVLNPNPFHWGYIWKDVGDADCDFKTTVNISGEVAILGLGRERRLQVKSITPDSKTESNIDWSTLGIDFTWEGLSNSVENVIDEQIEKTLIQQLNQAPINNPYYFVTFFKSLFADEIVPTQQEIMERIFSSERRHISKIIEREEFTGQYWSIGYEPNWFPRLEPQQYAEFYLKYYELIKGIDPTAKVLGPPITLTEVIDKPGDLVFSLIPELFLGMFADIEDELKSLINSYFNGTNSRKWYGEFLVNLPDEVKIDINEFHIFPLTAEVQPIDWDNIYSLMDSVAIYMRAETHTAEVWVTEFGNLDWKRKESEAANLCKNFCQYFKTNTVGITKWFWYLSKGHSPFFDSPLSPPPPVTALLTDKLALTRIGQVYLTEADNTPPVMVSAPTGKVLSANPVKIKFAWEAAQEFDTGIEDYQLVIKSEPDELIVLDQWIGDRLSQTIIGKKDQTYFACVRAKNGAGLIGDWSDWSSGVNAMTSGKDETIALKSTEKSDNENNATQQSNENKQFQNTNNSAANNIRTNEIPVAFGLSQNYPNPFNPTTSIEYQLPGDAFVVLKIYNSVGQEIKTLVNAFHPAGNHTVQWDGRDDFGNEVVSGIYLYRIAAGNYSCARKMALMR